jgi:hypothetical protein
MRNSMALVAIVAALALFGVVAVTIVSIPQQQAEARGCEFAGFHNDTAISASKGRCFGH